MSAIAEVVRQEYPKALPGDEVTESYLSTLSQEFSSDLKKMLFATSLCSDDINVSTDFRKVLHRPFTLGGLGGVPFTGLTGMMAYAHHIPDGGDAFILYGPHIGITDDGELGRMLRPGQSHLTNSCGALMLALQRLADADEVYVPVGSEVDYQQTLLERMVMPYKTQILEADNPKKEITEVAFKVIHKRLKMLVEMCRDEFSCNRLFMLGGVFINTSPEYHDYVDVRTFQTLDTKSIDKVCLQSLLQTDAFRNL